MCRSVVMDAEKLSVEESKNLEEVLSYVCKALPQDQIDKVSELLIQVLINVYRTE